MKSYIRIFLLVGLAVLLAAGYLLWPVEASAQTEQQSSDPVRTVQVTGVAESQVEPDSAVIRVGVQTEAETAQAALDQNSTRVQTLLDRLREADIPGGNIQTQTVNLAPRYDFDNTSNDRMLVGYTAYNVVEVRTENLDLLGGLLDQVVESGANIIEGIRFETSNSDNAIDELRETAVQTARHKAEELASLTGATLGPILEIQESSTIPDPAPPRVETRTDAGSVPVAPGTQTLSLQVQMTWTLIVSSEP